MSVSGRALNASGKPLADTKVLLFKQADIGEVVFGSVLAIGSLGTVCLLPDAPALCRQATAATTDQDGRYRFDLTGADTQGTLGTESTLNVVFAGDGTSTTISFAAQDSEVSLPDARLWNAGAKVSPGSGGIRLSWRALPQAAGAKRTHSAQLFQGKSAAALWSQDVSGNATTIDPRLLEDRAGEVAAGARSDLSGGSGAGKVTAYYLSQRLAVRATAGKPPSRGRPCASVVGPTPASVKPKAACGITDGDLASPAKLNSAGKGVVSGVVVDLGRTRSLSLIVARGFSGQVLVEISDDGVAYRTVQTALGAAIVVQPSGRPSARFVRLRSPTGLDESLASELSIW